MRSFLSGQISYFLLFVFKLVLSSDSLVFTVQVLGKETYHLRSDEGYYLNSLPDKDLWRIYRPVEEVRRGLKEKEMEVCLRFGSCTCF